MKGIAIKDGQCRQKADPHLIPTGRVTCDTCGVSFSLGVDPSYFDLKEQFASSVEKILAENHERGENHQDSIPFPDALNCNHSTKKEGTS